MCKQILPLNSFSPSKLGKFGVRSKCRPCCAKQAQQYRTKNPDKVAEYNKSYRANNPEKIAYHSQKFRAENPDYAKNYYAKHRETEIKRGKAHYWANTSKQAARKRHDRLTNPEKYRQRNKRYAQNNREQLNAKHARRRALKQNAKTYCISRKELWRLYNSKCFYCGDKSTTMDHVIPLSRGGSHGIGNLVPSCGPCNYSKAGRTITEWKIWKIRISDLPLCIR
jgi:5-methylcytosine-specific restriction endonuclease McrA